MYTKSLIQQKAELANAKGNFKFDLESLIDKYNIEDSIFAYNGRSAFEVCEGYFEVLNDYDSLRMAINECDINTCGIRVTYDPQLKTSTYQVGRIHKFINECDRAHKILDVDLLKYVNE